MTSSETLDRVWQHIDCLYQTVGELLEVQRTTVLNIQKSDEELSDTDRQLPDASQLLDQLSQLREQLNQQSKRVQQDVTETTRETPNYLKELSIERLNVIESDGTLRLVLCNTQHSPGHFMDGERFGEPDGKRPAASPHRNLWETVSENIGERIQTQSFETWFEPLFISEIKDTIVVFDAPDQLVAEWVEMNYKGLLKTALKTVGIFDRSISFKTSTPSS